MNSLTKEQGKSVGYLIQRVAVSRALFLSSSLFFFGGGVGRPLVCVYFGTCIVLSALVFAL